MTDQRIELVAQRLADELVAYRVARFTSSRGDQQKVLARVRAILAGQTIAEPPD